MAIYIESGTPEASTERAPKNHNPGTKQKKKRTRMNKNERKKTNSFPTNETNLKN